MKTLKTRTVHFVYSLRIFVSTHVIITSIAAPGMFANLCLVLLLLFADSPVPKFHFQLKKKKTREKSRKRSDKVQFGRWRDSFNSALCSLLSWSTLFQPTTARFISELHYNICSLLMFVSKNEMKKSLSLFKRNDGSKLPHLNMY